MSNLHTTHPIACQCGSLQGTVEASASFNWVRCYCRDCQTYIHHLEQSQLLDASGGTNAIQTLPRHIRWQKGVEHLACLRLSPRGLMRWYASCCDTPIGNTPANPKLSFVGLLIPSIQAREPKTMEQAFGPLRAVVYTQSATGPVEQGEFGGLSTLMRESGRLLTEWLTGRYKASPFFDDNGQPIVEPTVISKERRMALQEMLEGLRQTGDGNHTRR